MTKISARTAIGPKTDACERVGLISLNDRERCRRIAAALGDFYSKRGRTFPWRVNRAPYQTALAEILLTKTRAEAAEPVFSMLLTRYPSPVELAASDPGDLEASIRHLGLSAKRTKNLRGLAVALLQRGTEVLSDPAASLSLPGLWTYGSRAVACFAFGKAVGIVDANVRRVVKRAFALRETGDLRVQRLADEIAKEALNPAEANYGLLDVGALLCKRTPLCLECPLAEMCKHAQKEARTLKDREPRFDPQKLQSQRKAAGLSQRRLAAAVGVSQANIAELEAGKRPPLSNVLQRLAHTLGVEIDRLKSS